MSSAVVTGMIATYPVGGVAWDYGQYVLGLHALGFEVHYLEDTALQSYDPVRGLYVDDASRGVEFLEGVIAEHLPMLAGRWHVRGADGRAYGLAASEMADVVADADVLLNVSGGTLLRPEWSSCRRKVLIDSDPGWNQFVNYPRWDAGRGWDGALGYRGHDEFFTYAERLGCDDCPLPDLGLEWQPTRPPVVLDAWAAEPPGEAWTTVMTWDNFRRAIEGAGRVYGTKEMEFGRIEMLPAALPGVRLEVACGGDHAPRERWRELGWTVRDSVAVSRAAEDYRSYIQRSRGELSVAKNVYAATRCGWFSCRTVCYLAAGRPAVVQDTGFSSLIPCGAGLFAFSDATSARDAILRVESDVAGHGEAARMVASEQFGAERVLGDLLMRARVS